MGPRLLLLLPVLLLVSGGNASPVYAGWSSDPAQIKGTLNAIPRISSCTDGGTGTFVFWYETIASGQGDLRAQHVLVTGDLDPAWPPPGLLVGCGPGPLPLIGTLPDRAGGFYAWWNDSQSLRVLRLMGTGQVATGWDPCGVALGMPDVESPLPCFIEDGAQGFYAAWAEGAHDPPIPAFVHSVVGTPFEEWPQGGILRGTLKGYWPRIAASPDGGIFVATAFWSPDSIRAPGDYRLYKFTQDFADVDPAWPSAGLSFGRFHRELMGQIAGGLLDVCSDGRGGVFLDIGHVVGSNGNALVNYRIDRVTGAGLSATDWPSGGLDYDQGVFPDGMPPEGSVRVFYDGLDGVLPGNPEFFTDSPAMYGLGHLGPSGQSLPDGVFGILVGHDASAKGNGGLCMADFSPHGPTGPYQPDAYISFQQTNPYNNFKESDPTHYLPRYEAVAVAPTSDGGAVFFWSQVRDRYGLFARKFGPTGQVTGVGSGSVELGLRLFFRVDEGVHARWSMAAPSPARLDLFDITGRRRAQVRLERATGDVDVVLPATRDMAPGVYFARLTAGDRSSRQRLVLVK